MTLALAMLAVPQWTLLSNSLEKPCRLGVLAVTDCGWETVCGDEGVRMLSALESHCNKGRIVGLVTMWSDTMESLVGQISLAYDGQVDQ